MTSISQHAIRRAVAMIALVSIVTVTAVRRNITILLGVVRFLVPVGVMRNKYLSVMIVIVLLATSFGIIGLNAVARNSNSCLHPLDDPTISITASADISDQRNSIKQDGNDFANPNTASLDQTNAQTIGSVKTSGFKIESHLMTRSEMEAEKARIGVYDPSVNYTFTSSGLRTGLLHPNEAQWEAMVGTRTIVDKVVATAVVDSGISVDLSQSPYFPLVRKQILGDCAAYSEIYYSLGFLVAMDNGWADAYLGNDAHLLSPTWTYNKQNGGLDSGSIQGDNTKISRDFGAATWEAMPEGSDYTDWGSQQAWREAPLYRCIGGNTIAYDPVNEINNVKAVLDSGNTLDFALNAAGWSSTPDPSGNNNNIISSSEYPVTTIGHAQTIVGYDNTVSDNGEVGSFKVANSWGTSFGINGFYYITYQAFMIMAGHCAVNYIVYANDYQPSMIGVWHFNEPPSRDARMTVQAIDNSDGELLNQITPLIKAGDSNLMSTFMCLDFSRFSAYANNLSVQIELQIGSSKVPGNISSFRIEQYLGQYLPGKASCISGQSNGLPMATPCTAISLQQSIHPVSIPDALGWHDGAFSFAGDAQWVGVNTGNGSTASMQSGDVGDLGSSVLVAFIEGPGIFIFDWKVSSENGYDFLRFYYDGTLNGEISGEQGWTTLGYSIPAGVRNVMWSYEKDGGWSEGQDCGWVDNVIWTGRSAILYEGFESGSSSNWIYADLAPASGLDYWGNSSYRQFMGDQSAWCAQVGTGANGLPNYLNHYYDENMDSYMMVNLPDLTGLSNVRLSFYYWALTGTLSLADYAYLQVYENPTWNTFWTQPSVDSNGWTLAQVTIPADATYIAFRFYSDNAVGLEPYEGVYIDDVLLTVLDVQSPASSIGSLPTYTTTRNTTLTCAATDPGGSGVNSIEIYYRKGTTGSYSLYVTPSNPTGVWTSTSVDFNFSYAGGTEGTYQFHSIATDNHGNVETIPSTYDTSTIFDSTPPVTTATPSGALAPAWNNHSISITLSATDSTSGVSTTNYRLDGGGWTAYTAPIVVSSQGSHTLDYSSVDLAGNTETTNSVTFKIDTSLPVVSSSLSGSLGTNGWYISAVSITLTSSDSPSGIMGTKYRLDGGTWQTYTVPFMISSSGTHAVDYFSLDMAGNNGSGSMDCKIDRTIPTTSSDLSGTLGTDSWYVSSVTITLTPSDSYSGMNYTMYRIDGGSWQMYSGAFSVSTDGLHTVDFKCTDFAGNIETTKSVNFKIDLNPPTCTITSPSGGEVVSGSIVVTADAGDDASGITEVRFYLDSVLQYSDTAAPYEWQWDTTTASDGQHNLTATAYDGAGRTIQTTAHSITVGNTVIPEFSSAALVSVVLLLMITVSMINRRLRPPGGS